MLSLLSLVVEGLLLIFSFDLSLLLRFFTLENDFDRKIYREREMENDKNGEIACLLLD